MMNPVEKLIAFVSPAAALARAEARDALQRKYAGAKTAHWSSFKGSNTSSANANIESSWGAVTARTRQLIRDFPAFDGAINNMEAFIVGDGVRLQSVVLKPDGSPNRELSRMIEDKFMAWANSKKVDQSHQMTFVEMQQFVVRSKAETGDSLHEISVDPQTRALQLRCIDPATLSDLGWGTRATNPANSLWFGIEFERKTLRKRAYHFTPHTDFGSSLGPLPESYVIPAERILHGYRVKSADQLRGISTFASSLLLANAIRDFMQAELATQKAHSKWAAFVTSPSVGPGGWNKAQWDEANAKFVESLEYTSVEFLAPGQSVTLNSTQRSPEALEKFAGQVLRMCSSPIGVPYEILNGDYRGMNYSSLNTVRRDFSVQLKPQWGALINHFCRPVFHAWLDNAVLRGDLEIPDYWADPERYRRALWIPPGIAPVDPVKDANANIMLMKAGLIDPQSIIMNAGRDPDTVLAGIEAWKKELEDRDMMEIWESNIPPVIEPVDERPQDGEDNPNKKEG